MQEKALGLLLRLLQKLDDIELDLTEEMFIEPSSAIWWLESYDNETTGSAVPTDF